MKSFSFGKFLLVIFCLMVYLNIGWHLGTYMFENVLYVTPETGWAHFWAGGWDFRSQPERPLEFRTTLISENILVSIAWPVVLAGVLLSWVVFGVVTVLVWIWELLLFLLWLIFAGGFGEVLKTEWVTPFFLVLALLSLMFSSAIPAGAGERTRSFLAVLFIISAFFCVIGLFL